MGRWTKSTEVKIVLNFPKKINKKFNDYENKWELKEISDLS